MEFHHGKEYGSRVQEEPNSTQAQFVLDAIALELIEQMEKQIQQNEKFGSGESDNIHESPFADVWAEDGEFDTTRVSSSSS